MKRTLILLFVLSALIAAYLVVGTKDDTSSLTIEDREFILKDSDEVDVITIETKARPAIHLSKRKDGWYINNKQKANDRIVNNMLTTMKRMAIKYVPTALEHKTAVRRMAKHGIDIKTYDAKGNIITDFILGTNTSGEYGTYCMMHGANQSYAMSIPSITGGIRNYFTQSQEEMRELMVFSYETNDIRKVSIAYPKSKQDDFSITREGKEFQIESAITGELVNNIVDAYIQDYSNLVCEFVQNDHALKDSIISLVPFMIVNIEAQNKEPLSLKVYPTLDMTDTSVVTRSADDLTKFHQKYFAYSSLGDFYLIQNRFIKRFIKKPDYFYKK